MIPEPIKGIIFAIVVFLLIIAICFISYHYEECKNKMSDRTTPLLITEQHV